MSKVKYKVIKDKDGYYCVYKKKWLGWEYINYHFFETDAIDFIKNINHLKYYDSEGKELNNE